MNIPEIYEENPIIAAVKDDATLRCAIDSPCRTIFLLYGNICDISQKVELVKNAGKLAIVHTDLIDGLENRDVAVKFIRETTKADGIISTRAQIIRLAKDAGLLTVKRFFALDSQGLDSIQEMLQSTHPHLMEIMPGIIPKAIGRFATGSVPVIAGGLIETKAEITGALRGGAMAVSTGCETLWYL